MANVVAEGAYPYCRLTDQPLSVDEVLAAVSGPEQGGIVIFVGNVRDHNAGHCRGCPRCCRAPDR